MQLNSKIVMESMLIFNADDTKKKYQEEYNTIRKSLAEFFLSDYNVRNFDRFESLLVSHISNIREKPDLIRLVTGFATQIDSCHRETLDIAFVINSFKGLLPNIQNEVYKEVAYNIVNGYCDTFFIRLITFRDLGILDVFTKNIEFCRNSAFAIIENLVKMFDAYEHMRWSVCNQGPNEEVFGVVQIISHIINKNVERIRAEGSEEREKIQDLVATMVYCLIINLLFNKVVPVCDIKLTLQDIENNISSDFDLQCVVRDATTETLKDYQQSKKTVY